MDSAVEELFEDFEPQVHKDAVFSPAQMSAIQETVSATVNEALRVFNNHEAQARFPDDLRTPGPRMPNTATPLGLHRPLEKSLEEKILRGEYIDFLLCSYATRTRPRVPRGPRSLWLGGKNQ